MLGFWLDGFVWQFGGCWVLEGWSLFVFFVLICLFVELVLCDYGIFVGVFVIGIDLLVDVLVCIGGGGVVQGGFEVC